MKLGDLEDLLKLAHKYGMTSYQSPEISFTIIPGATSPMNVAASEDLGEAMKDLEKQYQDRKKELEGLAEIDSFGSS